MLLDLFASAYAGLAAIALSTLKHRRMPLPGVGRISPSIARAGGATLLALSLLGAIREDALSFGLVAWIGAVSLAALALVLLMSRWPRFAVIGGLIASLWAPWTVAAAIRNENGHRTSEPAAHHAPQSGKPQAAPDGIAIRF